MAFLIQDVAGANAERESRVLLHLGENEEIQPERRVGVVLFGS